MNWIQQEQRAIAEQDAWRTSRQAQRRFEDWSAAKDRAADSVEPVTDEDEDELEERRRCQ
jgi:parvulin-like peptidyl-prolyl isomerase